MYSWYLITLNLKIMKVNYVFLSIFLMFNSCISLKVGNKDVKTNNSTSNLNTIEFINSHKNKLEKMGGSMDDIFKCTCMLSDIKDWPMMSQEYKKFFNPQKLPARSAFAGSGLALGARLEIECMAIKKN